MDLPFRLPNWRGSSCAAISYRIRAETNDSVTLVSVDVSGENGLNLSADRVGKIFGTDTMALWPPSIDLEAHFPSVDDIGDWLAEFKGKELQDVVVNVFRSGRLMLQDVGTQYPGSEVTSRWH